MSLERERALNRLRAHADIRKIGIYCNPTNVRHGQVCLISGISDNMREVTFIVSRSGGVLEGDSLMSTYSRTSFKSVTRPDDVQRIVSHTGYIVILDISHITVNDAVNLSIAKLGEPTPVKVPVRLKSRSSERPKLVSSATPVVTSVDDCDLLGDAKDVQTVSHVKMDSDGTVEDKPEHYLGMVVTNMEDRSRKGWIGVIVAIDYESDSKYATIQWFLDGTGIHNVHSIRSYRKAAFAPVVCSLSNPLPAKKSQNIHAFDSTNFVECNFFRELVQLPLLAAVPEESAYIGLTEGMRITSCLRGQQNARIGKIQSLHNDLDSDTEPFAMIGWFALNGSEEVNKITKVSLSRIGLPIPPFSNILGVSGISYQPTLPHSMFSVYDEVKQVIHGNLTVNNPEMMNQPDFDLPDDHTPAESSAVLVKSSAVEVSLDQPYEVTPIKSTAEMVDKVDSMLNTSTMADAHRELDAEPITDCKYRGQTEDEAADAAIEETLTAREFVEEDFERFILEWDERLSGTKFFSGSRDQIDDKIQSLIEDDYTGELRVSGVAPLFVNDVKLEPVVTRRTPVIHKTRYFATFVNNDFCTLIPPVTDNVAPVYHGANVEVKELSKKVYDRYHTQGAN